VEMAGLPGPGGDQVEEEGHEVGQDSKQVNNIHPTLDKPAHNIRERRKHK